MRYLLLTIAVIATVFAVGYTDNSNSVKSQAFANCSENGTSGTPFLACTNYAQQQVDRDRHIADWLWAATAISVVSFVGVNNYRRKNNR